MHRTLNLPVRTCFVCLTACSTSTKPYSTEVVVRSACIYNDERIKIGECKPYLDFNFSELAEKVHRIEISYDYNYKNIGSGNQPSIKCYLKMSESIQISPLKGCPEKTTGSMWAAYENQTGFTAGSYIASFEHASGSSNPIIRINYKQ